MIKLVLSVGVTLLTLLWLNQEQRGTLTPPTTREVLATAIMPEIVSVPIPAVKKTRWSDRSTITTTDTHQPGKCHTRPGN